MLHMHGYQFITDILFGSLAILFGIIMAVYPRKYGVIFLFLRILVEQLSRREFGERTPEIHV